MMIYITQLIYLKTGQEKVFHEFEDIAIPLMEKYTGKIIQRIRPSLENFIEGEEDKPFEIHIISFDSDNKLADFLADKKRQELIHLKEASIKSTLIIKGHQL